MTTTTNTEETFPSKTSVNPPRPPNAFILFRTHHRANVLAERESTISKELGALWRSLSPSEKQIWQDQAEEAKKKHKLMWPEYKYSPKPRRRPNFVGENLTASSLSVKTKKKKTVSRARTDVLQNVDEQQAHLIGGEMPKGEEMDIAKTEREIYNSGESFQLDLPALIAAGEQYLSDSESSYFSGISTPSSSDAMSPAYFSSPDIDHSMHDTFPAVEKDDCQVHVDCTPSSLSSPTSSSPLLPQQPISSTAPSPSLIPYFSTLPNPLERQDTFTYYFDQYQYHLDQYHPGIPSTPAWPDFNELAMVDPELAQNLFGSHDAIHSQVFNI